jgi:hypothetical protein
MGCLAVKEVPAPNDPQIEISHQSPIVISNVHRLCGLVADQWRNSFQHPSAH